MNAHGVGEAIARPGQSLVSHLKNVAITARQFASSFGGGEEAWWTGILHDLGKLRKPAQQYLHGLRGPGFDTHHAPYGAWVAFENDWPAAAFSIAGHHAGLHDLSALQRMVEGPTYIREEVPYLLDWCKGIFGPLPPRHPSPPFVLNSPLSLELYARMLFSCLVDADRLDAERHETGRERFTVRLGEVIDLLLERIHSEKKKKPTVGLLNHIRELVFDQCVFAGRSAGGFFSLTVPTGGGKTLSSMAFSLEHAKFNSLNRVIIVIPYLSIIEQNAAIYRSILDPQGEGIVIEHHSAVPESFEEKEEGADPLSSACDNWDAPIVVTTSVQFIESLFASSPGRCRKLHNIAESVVVFDEVQTMPAHLLNPLLNILKELRANYRVSMVFMTATQPAFRKSVSLPEGLDCGEVREIIQNRKEIFSKLRRVEYSPPEKLDWKDLAVRLADCKQALCVVNIRRHAVKLWEALKDAVAEKDSVFHLSSSMCAAHRLAVLGDGVDPAPDTVRKRLKDGFPCRLVATQVVEAGVDIDFPVVFRAMGPLDSIAQAAGRCNREGLLRDEKGSPVPGRVVVFEPEEKGLPHGAYTTATQLTEKMMKSPPLDLSVDHEVYERYFAELYSLTNTGTGALQELREKLHFRQVAGMAKVIRDGGIPVAVPFGLGEKIISEIRNRNVHGEKSFLSITDLRRLQRFMVNVRKHEFDIMLQTGMIKALVPDFKLFVLEPGCYHEKLGVLINDRPLEDFLV